MKNGMDFTFDRKDISIGATILLGLDLRNVKLRKYSYKYEIPNMENIRNAYKISNN